jgi:hypothetical protein
MSQGRGKNTVNLLLETEVTPMQGHLARFQTKPEIAGEQLGDAHRWTHMAL